MLFGWTFVVLFASVALWNREDRRERAERALEMAREEFDIRVRERTAELSRANELLQQELAEHRRLSPPPPGP
jgi:C4-dicarboxylate-specific signal transduction histidine kinase